MEEKKDAAIAVNWFQKAADQNVRIYVIAARKFGMCRDIANIGFIYSRCRTAYFSQMYARKTVVKLNNASYVLIGVDQRGGVDMLVPPPRGWC